MALFDFFRRRRDKEGRPQSTGGIRGFFSRLFNRRKPEAAPEPEEIPEPAQMEEPDVDIDDSLFNSLEDVYTSEQERPSFDQPSVTTADDQSLLDKYCNMLNTMVDRGYIQAFESDQDAAEFLRVLSSEAWKEAHAYWYSVKALQQIQDAIARGATAGGLQEDYNRQVEKKSNNYLRTWEDWLRHE